MKHGLLHRRPPCWRMQASPSHPSLLYRRPAAASPRMPAAGLDKNSETCQACLAPCALAQPANPCRRVPVWHVEALSKELPVAPDLNQSSPDTKPLANKASPARVVSQPLVPIVPGRWVDASCCMLQTPCDNLHDGPPGLGHQLLVGQSSDGQPECLVRGCQARQVQAEGVHRLCAVPIAGGTVPPRGPRAAACCLHASGNGEGAHS